MSTAPTPSPRNLEFYRKQAKSLLKAARAGDAQATQRLRRSVPRLQAAGGSLPGDIGLYDAQLALARENGFASWPLFRADLLASRGDRPKRFRPHVRDAGWYEQRIAGVLSVHRAGFPETLDEIRRNHPRLAAATDDELREAEFTEDDARIVVAREHGFESWDEFQIHVQAIQSGDRREPLVEAFEAIERGDAATVAALVQHHPDLLDAQGTGGSSLLNLAVSTKQTTVCRLLLDLGSDVDLATTRGVTPLHEAAYSNQAELIEMLLDAGASPQMNAYGDGGTPLVMALFWGHNEAREALARRAIAPDNLRVAAGLGRLDLVKSFFAADGSLRAEAFSHRNFYRPNAGWPIWRPADDRQEVLDEAFTYAARNGRLGVLDFLLAVGANIDGDPYRGTALIWAAWKGRANVIRWLVDQGVCINRQATFGGVGHGEGLTALHAAAQTGRLDVVRILIERGADPSIRDALYNATASGWAEHHGHAEARDYLEAKAAAR
jgi:ankyrin repeat protein